MLDDIATIPMLEPTDLTPLEALGTRRSASPGDYLPWLGDETHDFYVVLSGAVE